MSGNNRRCHCGWCCASACMPADVETLHFSCSHFRYSDIDWHCPVYTYQQYDYVSPSKGFVQAIFAPNQAMYRRDGKDLQAV